MPSPFPGMDPWLEQPGVWDEAHDRLIVALADELGPRLHPRYRVAVERRAYVTTVDLTELVGKPDISAVKTSRTAESAAVYTVARPTVTPIPVKLPYEEVIHRFLEIRKPTTGEVVTAIEILSPKNKRPGDGREEYERKRIQVLRSRTHLVEIDLLRGWTPMEMISPSGNGYPDDYRILVSRSQDRPDAELYPFRVRDPIPSFPLPLLPEDDEPLVDLNTILHELYERAGFDLVIDYSAPPTPPLADEEAAWADALLQKQRSHPD